MSSLAFVGSQTVEDDEINSLGTGASGVSTEVLKITWFIGALINQWSDKTVALEA